MRHNDFIMMEKTHRVPRKAQEFGRTLMIFVFQNCFWKLPSLLEGKLPMLSSQAAVSTLNSSGLLSVQSHLTVLTMRQQRTAQTPAISMQNTSRCHPHTWSVWTDIRDKKNCLELTASGSPSETKDWTKLFELNWESWSRRPHSWRVS